MKEGIYLGRSHNNNAQDPDEILRELKHIAIDDKRKLTEVIVEALSEYVLKSQKKK